MFEKSMIRRIDYHKNKQSLIPISFMNVDIILSTGLNSK
jgi:hypothetical protein